jgi:transposase
MIWPPQCPDLNPIESIWDYVNCKLRKISRTSKDEMWTKLQNTWNGMHSEENITEIHFFNEKSL